MANTRELNHLKDYPIPVPKKIMSLTTYKRTEIIGAVDSKDTNKSDVKMPKTGSRSRSRSDLSDSTRSTYSDVDNDGMSLLTSDTSCPPSPMKSGSPILNANRLMSPVAIESNIITTPQDDFLSIIEPYPISAPDYSDLAPGGCPKFPVTTDENPCDSLPGYSPSVYKIGILSRKLEWLSPYEVASSRSWKNLIVELNSTQLNLYSVPLNLESHLMAFSIDNFPDVTIDQYRNYPSLKLDEHDPFNELNSPLTNRFDYEFYNCCNRLNFPRKLVRSYSLQHCKIGLASDYKKKSNVLRLRAESEQFLLAFQTTKDLIDWNLAINLAKDISLDIHERELPKYRTVPRRRRRRGDGTPIEPLYLNYNYNTEGRSRSLSESTNLMHKMSRFKLRMRRDSTSSVASGISIIHNSNSSSMTSISSMPMELSSFEPSSVEDIDELSDYNSDDDNDNDIDEIPDENDVSDPEISRIRKVTNPNKFKMKADDKWSPLYEEQTVRKFYKNCLRCIKPLNYDESWVSKPLVKPTSFANLALASSNSALNLQSLQNFKKSDVSLAKVPDHFVKEFVVGTHGLIPKLQIG